MNIELLGGFRPVWNWQHTSQKALDVLENQLRQRLHEQGDSEARAQLEQLVPCREELENFAFLSLWAVFEEALNTWLAQRTHWAGGVAPDEERIRSGLLRRIQHWGMAEKIDALQPLLGSDNTQDLHGLRKWRDWVAHRKIGARPQAISIDMAQSLLISAITQLEMSPQGATHALI